MGFIENGWTVSNGIVTTPSGIDMWIAYKFIQEAIYDGHLPVNRIIGFYATTGTAPRSARGARIIERDQNCAEDNFTIAAHLSKVLILDYDAKSPVLHTSAVKGELTVDNLEWTSSARKLRVLSSHPYIMRALGTAAIDAIFTTGTGYISADENFETIMKVLTKRSGEKKRKVSRTRYFPVFSYHNIIDFVKVLPFMGEIRLRYEHGFTDADLVLLFEKLFEKGVTDSWSENYSEVLR